MGGPSSVDGMNDIESNGSATLSDTAPLPKSRDYCAARRSSGPMH